MIIVLNNKCHLTKEEFKKYQQELKEITSTHKLILCPSTIHLTNFNLDNMELGSQNVSQFEQGAHTGEISSQQLKSYKVQYCIVGHSERRRENQETSKEINAKLKNLLKNEITPILCIGETLKERKTKQTKQIIKQDLQKCLQDLNNKERERIIIAYEPIWSIGTGKIPTVEEIKEVCTLIKEQLPQNKIIYGGSANNSNIEMLNKIPQINGYLLGGLSLKIDKLKEFIQKVKN